jgi:glucose/arabinose dehydrogenase
VTVRHILGITLLVAGSSTPGKAQDTLLSRYRVEPLATGLRAPWALAFLPADQGILITEKHGTVVLWTSADQTTVVVPGGPTEVFQRQDGGLLDVVLDPGFDQNGLVYIAFLEGTEAANRTALFRARFDGSGFVDGRVIFRAAPDKVGPGHPGGRMLFLPDSTLLLTIGDGYDYAGLAQSLRSHLGKVVRLNRDGSAPTDNPFRTDPSALPEVFTYGHRNSQGIAFNPRDSTVWSHEHGPKGGDEINLITAGANYGWPTTTYGIDYDDTAISQLREAPGMEGPRVIWVPSIAPSGFALYLDDRFPEWTGDFFVGALSGRHLRRVRLRDGAAVLQEVLLSELDARIRDVRAGPDGLLYVLTDDATNGRLLRLVPR